MTARLEQPRAAPAPRAAIYVRVSTDRQEEEGSSLETQEERARKYAAERGYVVGQVYRETKSGYRLYERPELMKFKASLSTAECPDVVIFYDPDRFSRNQTHIGMVLDWLATAGVRLEFVACEFENTAVGKFILNARVFAAELEREKILERTMRGRIKKVEDGRAWVGPRAPYGFRWTHTSAQQMKGGRLVTVEAKSKYEEDPDTAPIVRRIFHATATGRSIRDIARSLTDDHIPTVKGGDRWHHSSVHYILSQRCYLGEVDSFKWSKQETRRDGKRAERWTLKPGDDETRVRAPADFAPALVERQTWEAAQARLERNREHHGRQTRWPELGLLRGGRGKCGGCGSSLGVRPRGGPQEAQYYCIRSQKRADCPAAGSISVGRLDDAVWDRAFAILTDPAVVERELHRLETDDPTVGDLESIDKQLVGIQKRQAMLATLAAKVDDEEAAAPLLTELSSLAERKRALQVERQYVLDRRAGWEAARSRLNDIAAQCQLVTANASDLDHAGRRLALEYLDITATLWKAGSAEDRYQIRIGVRLDGVTLSRSSRRTSR